MFLGLLRYYAGGGGGGGGGGCCLQMHAVVNIPCNRVVPVMPIMAGYAQMSKKLFIIYVMLL